MANYNPKTDHLKKTQWQEGESGNPNGKPKGTKHLSKWIQEMLEDSSFEHALTDGTLVKGAPVKAIVSTLIIKALNGDMRAFDLIAKYGYGTRYDINSIEETQPIPILGGYSQLTTEELRELIRLEQDEELK